METTIHPLRIAVATLAGSALIASAIFAGIPSQAYANTQIKNGTATTDVYLTTDSSKIIASVPTQIDMAVSGDGTLTGPDAKSTQIINGSIFGIHVSNISVSEANSFSLVSSISGATANDSLQVALTPNEGTSLQLADLKSGKTIETSDWNLAKKDTTGSTIDLSTSGALVNITKDLSTSHKFATISWTFAPGTIS